MRTAQGELHWLGAAQLVGEYAERLEHCTRGAPYNWFNFYDTWAEPAREETR